MTQTMDELIKHFSKSDQARFYAANANATVREKPKDSGVHPNSKGCADAGEWETPPNPMRLVKAPLPDRIPRSIALEGSHIQVFYERTKVTASIQIPGNGTYWMKFMPARWAEENLMKAAEIQEDKDFMRYLWQEWLEPQRSTLYDRAGGIHQVDFAAACIANERDVVVSPRTFVLMFWNGNEATDMVFVNGTFPVQVELKPNPRCSTPKAPKWEGDVPR